MTRSCLLTTPFSILRFETASNHQFNFEAAPFLLNQHTVHWLEGLAPWLLSIPDRSARVSCNSNAGFLVLSPHLNHTSAYLLS